MNIQWATADRNKAQMGSDRDYKARRSGPPRARKSMDCPYSPSCFTCPKPDCVADSAFYYNEILDENLYLELLGPSDNRLPQ